MTEDETFETEDATQAGELIDFEDYVTGDSSFLKSPEIGKSIEFTIKEIRKMPKKTVVTPNKTFDVTLSKVDYYFDIVTTDDKVYSITKWQVHGKLVAIAKKLGKVKGVQVKIEHIADGRDVKVAWRVYAMVDGAYKELPQGKAEWV